MTSLTYLLEPYVEALGHVLTVMGMVAFSLLFCSVCMAGSYRKSELRKFQQSVRAGKGMSL